MRVRSARARAGADRRRRTAALRRALPRHPHSDADRRAGAARSGVPKSRCSSRSSARAWRASVTTRWWRAWSSALKPARPPVRGDLLRPGGRVPGAPDRRRADRLGAERLRRPQPPQVRSAAARVSVLRSRGRCRRRRRAVARPVALGDLRDRDPAAGAGAGGARRRTTSRPWRYAR